MDNPHARPAYTPVQWLQLEDLVLEWLRGSAALLLGDGDCIVTPDLTD